jgi:hypothetical protein
VNFCHDRRSGFALRIVGKCLSQWLSTHKPAGHGALPAPQSLSSIQLTSKPLSILVRAAP